MDKEKELAVVRRAYAKQVLAAARIEDPRVEAAFAAVRREDFLGPGPWPVLRGRGYVLTPSNDPVYLYTNDLVGVVPERHVNNGEPSFHALLIASAAPREGERVAHIGAGTGYYTAILAHLVGPFGKVTAVEIDPDLAGRAAANLRPFAQIEVVRGNGARVPLADLDVIYVNAGATRPTDPWLDGLADGGRLILPLTTGKVLRAARRGAVFRIERHGDEFLARWVSPVAIFPCAGARDETSETALTQAFAKGGWKKVTRLYRTYEIPEERCWLRAPGWCLAID